MGRITRVDVGNYAYHILNRANFRSNLFQKKEHYQGFIDIVCEALEFTPMRILAYCLMPNHWHMVLYPEHNGDLSKFMHHVTLTHTQRFHAKTNTIGYGHIYQGRYKSFLIQQEDHLLTVIRYVEGNAKRATLVKYAEEWEWSSAHMRLYGNEKQKKLLSQWPVEKPNNYIEWLNRSPSKKEIENIQYSLKRSRPYGEDIWINNIVSQFSLETVMRSRGRPKK